MSTSYDALTRIGLWSDISRKDGGQSTIHLVECFIDVFQIIGDAVGVVDHDVQNIDTASGKLEAAFIGSLQLAKFLNKDVREYDNARFAVCALVDEIMSTRAWMDMASWHQRLQQRKYYATVNAGEEFFLRLSNLGDAENEVREVYFVCLAMGFQGKYGEINDQILHKNIIDDNHLLLISDPNNSLPVYSRQKKTLINERMQPSAVVFWTLPVMALLATYLIIDFMLKSMADYTVVVPAGWVY